MPQVGGDGQWILGSVGSAGGVPPARGLAPVSVGGRIFFCRVLGRPSGLALPLERVLAAGAFGVHLENHGFMDQVTCRSHGGDVIGEHSVPCAERLVGGNHQRALLIAPRDPFEQDGRFGFIPAQIAKIVKDQQGERVP